MNTGNTCLKYRNLYLIATILKIRYSKYSLNEMNHDVKFRYSRIE